MLSLSDLEYGTSSREVEVVAAKLADALSPLTGWRPSAAAPVEFFQKEEIIMVGSMDRIPPCWARTSFACEVCGVDVSHEGGVVLVSMWSKRCVFTSAEGLNRACLIEMVVLSFAGATTRGAEST